MKLRLFFFLFILSHILPAQNFTESLSSSEFDGVRHGSTAFSDVDGDGDQDVIITGENNLGESIAKLYLNDGLGSYNEVSGTPFEGVRFSSIAFSDVDEDGDSDILITGWNSSEVRIAKLYTNNGTGSFNEVLGTPFEGVKDSSVSFSDVDGDGDSDVLISGRTSMAEGIVKLYINDGTGSYSEAIGTPFEVVGFSSTAFSDVDGDGDSDLLIAGSIFVGQASTNLYTNDGDGNFNKVVPPPFEDVTHSSIAFSDVDGDGDNDVLITGVNNSNELISKLYTNDGAGNFSEVINTPFDAVNFSSVAFSDVDGDGDSDVLIAGRKSPAERIAKLYTNDGTGNFSEILDTPFEKVTYCTTTFSDVDGDGDNDVLITGTDNLVENIAKLYINNEVVTTLNFSQNSFDFGFTLYPNPASSMITPNLTFVSSEISDVFIKFYTLEGVLIRHQREIATIGKQSISLDIASLAKGIYLVELDDGKRKGVSKLIIQ